MRELSGDEPIWVGMPSGTPLANMTLKQVLQFFFGDTLTDEELDAVIAKKSAPPRVWELD